MPENEIEPQQWEDFFDRISAKRNGWYIAIDEMPTAELQSNPLLEDIEEQAPSGDATLQSIRFDADENCIMIEAESRPQPFTQIVNEPQRIGFQESLDLNARTITIDDARGMTTIIYLRNPVLPETVEGEFEPELRPDNPDPNA